MKKTKQENGKPGAAARSAEANGREASKRSAVGAPVVYQAVLLEGEEELGRTSSALAWSGLAAGLSMGFSLVTQGILRAHLTEPPWQFLVSKLGYCVGFLIVILGRQQLFTENTLTVVLPLLQRRNMITFLQVMRLWSLVLLFNLAGAFLFAWSLSHSGIFDPAVNDAFEAVGRKAMEVSPGIALVRGVFAGWLIALMIWLLPAAEGGKVPIIIIITYLVGIGHFNHIVAGSVDTLYLVVIGTHTLGDYFLSFALPTLAGNILGGVTLVAFLEYAQVHT